MKPICLLPLLLAAVFSCPLDLQAAGGKPNFVVINIDDLGYADIGAIRLEAEPHAEHRPDGRRGLQTNLLLRGAGVLAVARFPDDRLLPEAGAAHSRRAVSGGAGRTQSGRAHRGGVVEGGRLCHGLHRQMASGRPAGVSAEAAGV